VSTNRTRADAGWIGTTKEKGPNGRGLCRWCHQEVPKGKRTFCSKECVHEWKLRTDIQYMRHQLFERDHGVCALCHLDTVALVKKLAKLDSDELWPGSCYAHSRPLPPRLLKKLEGYRIPEHRWRIKTYKRERYGIWDADHITPVVEGGGECGLEGYRTLCCKCHKEETKELAGRRAKKRKELAVSSPSSLPHVLNPVYERVHSSNVDTRRWPTFGHPCVVS
jgi:5-methylcytosine-specific restriction enzyme A